MNTEESDVGVPFRSYFEPQIYLCRGGKYNTNESTITFEENNYIGLDYLNEDLYENKELLDPINPNILKEKCFEKISRKKLLNTISKYETQFLKSKTLIYGLFYCEKHMDVPTLIYNVEDINNRMLLLNELCMDFRTNKDYSIFKIKNECYLDVRKKLSGWFKKIQQVTPNPDNYTEHPIPESWKHSETQEEKRRISQ